MNYFKFRKLLKKACADYYLLTNYNFSSPDDLYNIVEEHEAQSGLCTYFYENNVPNYSNLVTALRSIAVKDKSFNFNSGWWFETINGLQREIEKVDGYIPKEIIEKTLVPRYKVLKHAEKYSFWYYLKYKL